MPIILKLHHDNNDQLFCLNWDHVARFAPQNLGNKPDNQGTAIFLNPDQKEYFFVKESTTEIIAQILRG